MGGDKIIHEFEVNDDHVAWLKGMKEKYDLTDENKALRCLIEFAMSDGDADSIFGDIRCNRC